MNRNILSIIVLAMLVTAVISGCGGAPTTPTKAAVTSAPPAITVIVTATIPPPPPTLAIPTLTPIPTAVITATTPITTPGSVKTATPVSGTPRATATRKPPATATKAATVAPTAVPLKYAAPTPLEPIYGNGRTDSRHYPGESLIFKWTAVAGLAPNECYLVNVAFNPGQGDSFLTACGDQTAIGAPITFVLSKPGFPSPTYASLLPNAGQEITVVWHVTVVRDQGLKPDNVHHNTAPLSPPSSTVQFLLIGS